MWSCSRIEVLAILGMMLCPVCIAQDACYTAGGVAGIVIATVVVTLVLGGLAVAIARHLWKQRKASYKDGEKVTVPDTCLPEKQLIGSKNDYAFDNPYFKDDDGDQGSAAATNATATGTAATPDAAEKGEAGFTSDRRDNDNSQNIKANSGSKLKKNKPFNNIPFYSVFGQGNKKPKAMDDTFVTKQCERISVPLRGHDFTGLGFNICGNMRDGIFVKDVLHRGPASESGKIKGGDRILSVTVSFASIVYEDALTILSYASPYDVKLDIEEGGEKNVFLATSSPGKRLASASFRNGGQKLFHPLYRSQSIDDLTQIGKDSFLLQTKSASAASSYKRSPQSTQAAANLRVKALLKTSESSPDTKILTCTKPSRKSSSSSDSSSSKKISTEILESSSCEALAEDSDVFDYVKSDWKKDSFLKFVDFSPEITKNENSEDSKTVVVDTANLKLITEDSLQKHEVLDVFKAPEEDTETAIEQQPNLEEPLFELKIPKAPPRKQNAPGKRKAPSPPKFQPTNSASTETSAVVHQVEDILESDVNANFTESEKFLSNLNSKSSESKKETDEDTSIIDNGGKLIRSGTYNLIDETCEKTINSNSSLSGSLDSGEEISDPPSPKRKASSLGDLTKLNEDVNKKVSSTILERAVSLDLQQQHSLPEGNLERQKKILKPPIFTPEDTSEEDFQNVRDQDSSAADWEIDPWRNLSGKPVDNSDSDIGDISVSSGASTLFQTTTSLVGNTSIANGHHSIPEEQCKLDDTSTAGINVEDEISTLKQYITSAPYFENNYTECKNTTSTPARKAVEFDSFLQANSPIKSIAKAKDEEYHLRSEKPAVEGNDANTSDTMGSSPFSRSTHSVSVPVSLSIPIIPPVIHHYEKLSISPSSNIQGQKDSFDDSRQDPGDTHAISSYKPIFVAKQFKTTNTVLTMSLSPGVETMVTNNSDETRDSWDSKEDSPLNPSSSINGDESSVGQYRTAVEFPAISDNTVFVTSKLSNILSSVSARPTDVSTKYSVEESEAAVHGKDLSKTKTLLEPTDEDLTKFGSGSNSPPPQLEPPQ